MLFAEAAALHHPLDVERVRDVPADPHQEDRHHAEREGKAQIVVRVLAQSRDRGERLRPDEGQEQLLAEGDVQSRQRENDEADRRHPMHEPLEGGKTHHHASRSGRARSAPCPRIQIERHHAGDHAENGQAAGQPQHHLIQVAPVAAAGLFERAGFLIGNAALAGNALELLSSCSSLTDWAVGLIC